GLTLVLLRGLAWFALSSRRRSREGLAGALLVGAPTATQAISRRIDAFPEAGLRVAATYAPTNTNGERSRARALLRSGAVIDILGSAFLLLLLAPVLVVVSLAIWIYDGRPVIYRQKRVGRDNREFTIWKFRSMVPGADKLNDQYADANVASGLLFKLPDDPR